MLVNGHVVLLDIQLLNLYHLSRLELVIAELRSILVDILFNCP